jgi:hypothetical protein
VKQRRFVREAVKGDTKFRSRPGPPGDLLGRMWTLFGPPDAVTDDGFSYGVRDRVTGVAFEVYSGASGPAYGARDDEARLPPVLDAFEALLAKTPLADCAIEIPTRLGRVVVGAAAGQAFHKAVSRPRTAEQALAEASRVLAQRDAQAMAYVEAMLHLKDDFSDRAAGTAEARSYRALMRGLWKKTLETAAATLERELARGAAANRSAIIAIADVVRPALEQTAALGGVDYAREAASFRQLVNRARQRLKASPPPGSRA